ncbi:MAG: DUF2911 domain-containing protein [Holophagales bacterium]|jgi:hypothetical protein|nr:DUF2911 domain-containing protein [Holophagales bacterium]
MCEVDTQMAAMGIKKTGMATNTFAKTYALLAWSALLFALPFGVFSPNLSGQDAGQMFPQKSPKASVSQVVGTCTVTIEYHRPRVRNRVIWGELVPFGEVWRTGANEATTIAFSHPVKVAGTPVPAGKYALFTIPGRDRWTVILNKRHQQMGSFEYSPLEDLLRFDVRPIATSYTEYLSFEIYPADDSSAYVDLDWEKLRIYFLVEVDLDKAIEARMNEILAGAKKQDWRSRCEAAQYLLDSEKDMPRAMKLIEESIKIRKTPQNLYVKAQILRWAGSAAEAAKILDQAIELAKTQNAPAAVAKPMEITRAQWLGQRR